MTSPSIFLGKDHTGITAEQREELLAELSKKLDKEFGLNVGETLDQYAKKETDPKIFKAIVSKTVNTLRKKKAPKENEPKEALAALNTALEGSATSQSKVIYAEQLFSILPEISEPSKETDKALETLQKISSHLSEQFSDKVIETFIMEHWDDDVLSQIKEPITKAYLSQKLINNSPILPVPKKADDLSRFAVERVITAAQKIKDIDEKLYYLGYVGLNHSEERDSDLHKKARNLLLEEIEKAVDIKSIAQIVLSTKHPTSRIPDTEIDSAGAKKWKTLTADLGRKERFEQAIEVAASRNYMDQIDSGKTLQETSATVLDIAKEYMKEKQHPDVLKEDTVKDALKRMARSENGDYSKAAQALLDKFPQQEETKKTTLSIKKFLME